MKLSSGDKTIGFSIYADQKPLSITVGTTVPPDPMAGLSRSFGAYPRLPGDKESKEDRERRERHGREEERQRERPLLLAPSVTLGVGLDRVTAEIGKEDFVALKQALRHAEEAIDKAEADHKAWQHRVAKEREEEKG